LVKELPKSLCLIPDHIRIAAQNDGWIVRSSIVWEKPNSIPESVKDRCAHSYEDVIMLTPRKNYFWEYSRGRGAECLLAKRDVGWR
jgi:DNA modification methylase